MNINFRDAAQIYFHVSKASEDQVKTLSNKELAVVYAALANIQSEGLSQNPTDKTINIQDILEKLSKPPAKHIAAPQLSNLGKGVENLYKEVLGAGKQVSAHQLKEEITKTAEALGKVGPVYEWERKIY